MNAIAGRIASVARIVGLEKDVVMVGEWPKTQVLLTLLKRIQKWRSLSRGPDYMGALGAAETAATGVYTEEVKQK